jgi:polyhydroxyalkanoate synthesis regulator phasin
MLDAVKNYLNLASGITEVTRQRAVAAAKALASSGEATAEQVQNLADDLLVSSRNNRDAMLALVRFEVDRALNRLGLATADEVASLQRRVTSLEGALAKTSGGAGTKAQKSPGRKAATKTTTKSATKATTKAVTRTATKTAAAKSAAKSTAAKSTAAKSTAAKSTAAKSTAAKSPAAKSSAARSTAAKSTAAKAIKAAPASPNQAPAKKSASSAPPSSS